MEQVKAAIELLKSSLDPDDSAGPMSLIINQLSLLYSFKTDFSDNDSDNDFSLSLTKRNHAVVVLSESNDEL